MIWYAMISGYITQWTRLKWIQIAHFPSWSWVSTAPKPCGPASAVMQVLQSPLKYARTLVWATESFNFWNNSSCDFPQTKGSFYLKLLLRSSASCAKSGKILTEYYTRWTKDLTWEVSWGELTFRMAPTLAPSITTEKGQFGKMKLVFVSIHC